MKKRKPRRVEKTDSGEFSGTSSDQSEIISLRLDRGGGGTTSTRNIPDKILDLDKYKYLARKNLLLPTLRRLPHSVVERYSDKESTSDSDISSPPPAANSSTAVSSSIPQLECENSLHPLRIRFANLTKQSKQPCSPQYSIVQSDVFRSDLETPNCDKNEFSENDFLSDAQKTATEVEYQPFRKVWIKDTSKDSSKTAPILKISFGKQSAMAKSDDCAENEGCASASKAAKKALKRAKKEAARRAGQSRQGSGLLSPARTYLASKSPHNLANVSPGASPAHWPPCPSPAHWPPPASPVRLAAASPGAGSPAHSLVCPAPVPPHHAKKAKKKKRKKRRDGRRDDIENVVRTCSGGEGSPARPAAPWRDETASSESGEEEAGTDTLCVG